jgi:hypothetical protein
MCTVSTELLCPSLTVTLNSNVVPVAGAVKVTVGPDVLLSVTGVPRA